MQNIPSNLPKSFGIFSPSSNSIVVSLNPSWISKDFPTESENDKEAYSSVVINNFAYNSDKNNFYTEGILSSLEPSGKGPIRKQPTNDLLTLYFAPYFLYLSL